MITLEINIIFISALAAIKHNDFYYDRNNREDLVKTMFGTNS